VDRDYNIRALTKRLQRISKDISAEGRQLFDAYIPDGDIGAFAAHLPDALEHNWAETMAMLRDPNFQHLLEHYPRTKNPFVIAESVEDVVTSGYLIRLADGRTVKPDDYLEAFERFVRENPEHVEAIRILLERPADWRTNALYELRKKLQARPEHFTEDNLRRAYQHELADIISIVKHAGKGEPLLSAEERVSRAMARVRAGQSFTSEQERWLELISSHLVENLAIERDDFDLMTFTREGASWERVNRDFAGQLQEWINAVNLAMAQ
jgi:type I restriction enzyme R subunit